jgi:hypothetical protein
VGIAPGSAVSYPLGIISIMNRMVPSSSIRIGLGSIG